MITRSGIPYLLNVRYHPLAGLDEHHEDDSYKYLIIIVYLIVIVHSSNINSHI